MVVKNIRLQSSKRSLGDEIDSNGPTDVRNKYIRNIRMFGTNRYVRQKPIYSVHNFGKIYRTDFNFGTLRTEIKV